MTIGERLKLWRADKHLKQEEAASLLGIPYSTYQKYEINNKKPGADAMESFARAGINVTWLLTGADEVVLPGKASRFDPTTGTIVECESRVVEYKLIPFYDGNANGDAKRLIDQEHKAGEMAFSNAWLNKRGLQASACALVRVKGDTMTPTMYEGDLLLVDTGVQTIKEDGIYLFYSDYYFARRIQRSLDGSIAIITDNPQYRNHSLTPEEAKKVVSAGRVRWIGHEF